MASWLSSWENEGVS
jgi:hypothetical protein